MKMLSAFILSLMVLQIQTKAHAQVSQENLAWRKKVVGSTGKGLGGLVDGNYRTPGDIPAKGWFYVDLEKKTTVERVFMTFRGASPGAAKLFTSDDAVAWTEVWQGCSFPAAGCPFVVQYPTEVFLKPVSARYFKLEIVDGGGNPQISLYEFELYAPDSSTRNLAEGKSAISLGYYHGQMPGKPMTLVTDGNLWSGTALINVPPWVTVDLGAPTEINRIRVISNHDGPSRKFSFSGSLDNKEWTPLFSVEPGVIPQAWTPTVFKRTMVRFVKGVFEDKAYNGGAFVMEIFIYGPAKSSADILSLPANQAQTARPDGGMAEPLADAGAALSAVSGKSAEDAGPAAVRDTDAGASVPLDALGAGVTAAPTVTDRNPPAGGPAGTTMMAASGGTMADARDETAASGPSGCTLSPVGRPSSCFAVAALLAIALLRRRR